MSVTVTYAATVTVAETLATNTGSAPASTRLVTHTDYNEAFTLNAASTPPATTVAEFLLTLSGGTATVDFRALTGTNGAVIDGNGLKVQILRIKNLGANKITITEGASNGLALLGASIGNNTLDIFAGAHVMFFFNDASPDIASGDKTIDVTGTTTQTSEWSVVMG